MHLKLLIIDISTKVFSNGRDKNLDLNLKKKILTLSWNIEFL